MKTDPANPRLMHFTHVENLPGIIRDGLVAPSSSPETSIDCAEAGIKQQRCTMQVPIPPRGVVADYVPFYYAPRSPMLYRIMKGGVASYQHGQEPLVYICTRLDHVETVGAEWVATDRNAAVATARYTTSRSDLHHHIDWELMEARDWADTPSDGGRKQRRQAELLVHRWLPWTAVAGLVTCTNATKRRAEEILAASDHRPDVLVLPAWYF